MGIRKVDTLQKTKTFELKPGVFDLVRRLKELEQIKEMPDVFTAEEMQRFKWLITNKPRRKMKLAETGTFSYWTIARWINGINWPRRGLHTRKLRTWINKLERLTKLEHHS